jgi:thymidylate synthase
MIKQFVNGLHPEYQYLKLVDNIIKNGIKRKGRNGNTYSIFGTQMRYPLYDNTFPLLTTKKMFLNGCIHELLWFINGHTNNKYLKDKKVHIWDGNSSREFLNSRGLQKYNEDELGPIYGFQWRNFNGDYIPEMFRNEFSIRNAKKGTDQLQYIIDSLNGNNKNEDKFSRRLIVSAWNPNQLNDMALPPCHIMFQFFVNNKDELSCSMYQRSGDVGLGIPFNIASYSLLTYIIAHHCGLKPGEFIHTIGDAHIYENHIEKLKLQIERKPYDFPTIYIKNKYENIEDYTINDFYISNYLHHKPIKMDMIS